MGRAYDAIVVGSGATGSWVAKELTENGFDIAVLEAGPLFEHVRSRTSAREFAERYPIQSKVGVCNPSTQQLFVDDIDNPYTVPPDRPFTWIRGRIVGGRLRTWGRVCLRLSEHELTEAERDGYGPCWPISYRELAPFYGEVERFLSVTGHRDGLSVLPDGEFVEPVCGDGEGYRRLADVVPRRVGHRVIAGRVALRDAAAMLTAAASTGHLTLRPNAIVRRVITDGDRATGIELIDRDSHRSEEVFARVIVLAASAIESTRILLMSADGGLGNASGVLGRHLMDHVNVVGHGTMPGVRPLADRIDVAGRIYVPRFRNVGDTDPRFIRGYGIDANVQGMAFGQRSGDAYFYLSAMGEMLPRPDNRVTLDPVVKDAWGLPAARIDCTFSDNERAMAADMKAQIEAIVAAAGFEYFDREAKAKLQDPGTTIHEVGTARMGADRTQSYLDPHNRAWEVRNLYVVDGSCFPTTGWQNPALTMMALALRAARHIAAEGRRHQL